MSPISFGGGPAVDSTDFAPSPHPLALEGSVETMRRESFVSTSAGPLATGRVHFTFFAPEQSAAGLTKIECQVGGTAAAATPTLVRMGFYLVPDAGADLTLECATNNLDTAGCEELTSAGVVNANVRFGANTFAAYNAPMHAAGLGLPTSYSFLRGQMYAFAIIVVSASAMPTFYGSAAGSRSWVARTPRICAALNGQSDLPATIAVASLESSTVRAYASARP